MARRSPSPHSLAAAHELVPSRLGTALADVRGREVRRQRDGTGARIARDEMRANSLTSASRSVPRRGQRHVRGRRQSMPSLGFVQVKHQVVGAQARDVHARIATFQRIVEVVREEHRLELALRARPAAASPLHSSAAEPASYSDSQLSSVMCSSANPKNVCAISISQLY